MSLSPDTVRQSRQLIIDTFYEFRDELMQSYGKIASITKQDGSLVTELDFKIEQELKKRLASSYPEIGFYGEESGGDVTDTGAVWVTDPIDGTPSFIHGLPYCANMAGLIVDGEIFASVIYHFVTDELYTAIRGEGAYRNDQQIFVRDLPPDSSITFANPFSYKNVYPVLEPHGVSMYAPIGASGYEYTRLAQGNIHGVVKLRGHSLMHDNVPGVLLATEAGAEVVSFDSDTYRYDNLNLITTTPSLAKTIRENCAAIQQAIA